MTTPLIRSTALAVALAVGATLGAAAIPQRASANSTTTLAIAAAAIVGLLLIDSSNNRPYYVRDNHRYYVSDQTAQYYYQNQDPQYYREHRGQWSSNRQRFVQDWQRDHRGRGHHHG